jgi:hypothetical protein
VQVDNDAKMQYQMNCRRVGNNDPYREDVREGPCHRNVYRRHQTTMLQLRRRAHVVARSFSLNPWDATKFSRPQETHVAEADGGFGAS